MKLSKIEKINGSYSCFFETSTVFTQVWYYHRIKESTTYLKLTISVDDFVLFFNSHTEIFIEWIPFFWWSLLFFFFTSYIDREKKFGNFFYFSSKLEVFWIHLSIKNVENEQLLVYVCMLFYSGHTTFIFWYNILIILFPHPSFELLVQLFWKTNLQ